MSTTIPAASLEAVTRRWCARADASEVLSRHQAEVGDDPASR